MMKKTLTSNTFLDKIGVSDKREVFSFHITYIKSTNTKLRTREKKGNGKA